MQQEVHPIDKVADLKYGGSRRRLALAIDENPSFLGKIVSGDKKMSPIIAAKLAAEVGDDPRAAALTAVLSQAKDDAERRSLSRLFKLAPTAAVALATAVICGAPSPSAAQGSTDAPTSGEGLYIMTTNV